MVSLIGLARSSEPAHLVERVRADDGARVSLDGTDVGKRGAGAAAGVLHDALTGFEITAMFRLFDDRQRHSVLVAPRGISRFELHDHLRGTVRDDALQAHQGSVSDGGERRIDYAVVHDEAPVAPMRA